MTATSPYLNRPLRSEAEASRQLQQNSQPPIDLAHARYLRELERIRNANRQAQP